MVKPKVSLIMAVYNGEEFIANAINMVVAQTIYNNIEFILINDGSTDNTLNIIKEFQKKYSFKLITYKTNKKLGYARNKGIEIATGKYIMFVDCDDYIETEHLERAYNFIEREKTDLLIFDYAIRKLNSKTIQKVSIKYPPNTEFTKEQMIKEILVQKNGIKAYSCMKVFKTKILKKNNIKYNQKACTVEDALFAIKYTYYCNKISYMNDYTYYYLKRMGSNSNKINKEIIDSFYLIISEIIKFLKSKKRYKLYMNECDSMYNKYYAALLNKIMYFKNEKEEKLELIKYANKKFKAKQMIHKLNDELYNSQAVKKVTELVIGSKFDENKIYKELKENSKDIGYI